MELFGSPIIVSSRLIQHHEWPFVHSLARLLEGKAVSLRERSEAASSVVSIRRTTSGVGDTSRSRLGDEFAILSRSRKGS